MLTCFVCKIVINNPDLLFDHIKKEHKICGNNCKVQCTLCWKKLSTFSTFKVHVRRCFDNAQAVTDEEDAEEVEVDPELYMYAIDTQICNFQSKFRKSVLKLVCGLSAKMNWARQDVFTTMSEVKNTLISQIISGI